MEQHDHAPRAGNGSLKTTAFVLYGSLAALLLLLPGPVADWCDDHADWAIIRAAGSLTRAVDDASHRLHVADVFETARRRFSALIER